MTEPNGEVLRRPEGTGQNTSPQVEYLKRLGFDEAAAALQAADVFTSEPDTRLDEPDMQRAPGPHRSRTRRG